MFKLIGIAILLIALVQTIFDVEVGGAILIICLFIAIIVIIAKTTSNNADREFNETKGPQIKQNQELFEQYSLDFMTQKENIVGSHPPKTYKVDANNSVFRTADDELIIAVCVEPQNYVEDKTLRRIKDSQPGRFDVNHRFHIHNILFWNEKGNVQYTSNVSGGGVNVQGAVAGSIIAGDVGAIIGSREAVTTTTETHDSREVLIKLTNGEEFKFPYEYRDAFAACMPEKEYTFILLSKQLNV